MRTLAIWSLSQKWLRGFPVLLSMRSSPQPLTSGSTRSLGAVRSVAATVTATCHCGAVHIHVRKAPRTLTQCNCSICRRYGALWAYYVPSSVHIEAPRFALERYSWKNRIRDYYRCKKCGCVTHYKYRKRSDWNTVGVNAVNFDPAVITAARIRRLDGAKTWKFLD